MYVEDDLQGIDHKSRLKRQMEAYEEAEMEGKHGLKREDRVVIDIYK